MVVIQLKAMREAEAEKKEAAELKGKLDKVIIENSEKVHEPVSSCL